MRGRLIYVAALLAAVSCSKDIPVSDRGLDYEYGRDIRHDMIVLGGRLENPYKTENMTRALNALYPVKADRVEVETTDLYVRFLPADDLQADMLEDLGLTLTDHPLDYEIAVDGDWYHDPDIPDGRMTWQYAVVPSDFEFPDIEYEIIDECHISEHRPGVRSDDGIDWTEVERMSYMMTGNGNMISETRASSKTVPSGRITIVDEDCNGGRPFGVAGVRVSCNSFVKFDHAYTDRDGYYTMEKEFSANLRYRLVFKNERGFYLGFNLVLVPASVSTLGKASPSGVNMTITHDSEEKLFRRCAVNNAAYDFFRRCPAPDLGIACPPVDLRIWLFNGLEASSAVMMHHGAVIKSDLIGSFLGDFASLVEFFLPDITIGTKGRTSYMELYSAACHELAHASHFSAVGASYWNRYIRYVIESYLLTGGMTYGDGTGNDAGHCAVGEMWAYFLEAKMYNDRYGGVFPSFGTSFWFHPQIFRYMNERGFSCSEIYAALGNEVSDPSALRSALVTMYPARRTVIEQGFSRY